MPDQWKPESPAQETGWFRSVTGSESIAEFTSDVASLICEVERNWKGGLFSSSDLGHLERMASIPLAGFYLRLSEKFTPEEQCGEFRDHWVGQCLLRFRHALRPPEKIFSATANRDSHVPHIRAIHDSAKPRSSTLRPDQMISSRQWRIWFHFENASHDKWAANLLIRSALNQLCADLKGVTRFVSAYKKGGHKIDFFDISPGQPGGLFESLIVDILNEKKCTAKQASLPEDILEQTDIRVKYPDLIRPSGARVQVGFQSKSEVHEEKLKKLHFREEFVVLSPLELARLSLEHPKPGYLSEINWQEYWKKIGEECWDLESLAGRLKGIFFRAFKYAAHNPMGAMQAVPQDLRHLIRLVVEYRAFEATKSLRARERMTGTFLPSSRKIGR